MAYYLVSAKPKPDRLPDLLGNLQEKVYLTMRPFGRSLTHSLENARLRDDGYAIWEEEDYCTPPLAQERAAALDEFFDDLEVTVVERGEGWAEIEEFPRLFPQVKVGGGSSCASAVPYDTRQPGRARCDCQAAMGFRFRIPGSRPLSWSR